MSRNIRAVRVEWGPFASVFMASDRLEELLDAIIGDRFRYRYDWNGADEVYKFWTGDGARFLDLVRDCNVSEVVAQIDEDLREDALACLENLKAMELSWRKDIDKDGQIELWVDGC